MYEAMLAETVCLQGDGGDEIAGYLARPLGPGPFPSVVVIHHAPGWDAATKEIARRFAAHGYIALSHHLYHREGPDASPDDAAAVARAAGGVPDARFLGDTEGAIRFLRSLPYANGRVGAIGFCSGGRQTFLAACNLPLDAAVDCYGACVANPPPATVTLRMHPILDQAPRLGCPLLGLFGEDDKLPAPAETAHIAAELDRLGKTYSFHTYPGAGHAFFAVDRPSYRPEAAVDGWGRILEWFGRYLAPAAPEAS